MSEEVENKILGITDHPLWSSILQWCEGTTGPAMPWLPPHEFLPVLESFKFDPYVSRTIQQTYDHSEIVRRALFGGAYDPSTHEVIYHSAGHRLGGALCFAAGLSLRASEEFFKDFAASTHMDGFLTALEVWEPQTVQEGFEGKKEIPWVSKFARSKEDEQAAAYWLDRCRNHIDDTTLFLQIAAQAVWNEGREARKTQKRRMGGVKKQKGAEFARAIKILWVPAALWNKPESIILGILAPGRKTEIAEAYEKIRKDISRMKFSTSWRKSLQ